MHLFDGGNTEDCLVLYCTVLYCALLCFALFYNTLLRRVESDFKV